MRVGLAIACVIAIVVSGFAGYEIGRHASQERQGPIASPIRTVTDELGAHRVIRLHDGDIVRRPEAATECLASGEGGFPNLFCTRIEGGRHEVIFYSDSVQVWPLDCRSCGPDGPVFDYLWTPYLLRASATSQRLGRLELRARETPVTYADAIREFGKPASCAPLGGPSDALAVWPALGLRLRLSTLGAMPAGKTGCSAPGMIQIATTYVSARRWQTTKGLRVGLPAATIKSLYPDAMFQRRRRGDWPGPAYWIVHARTACIGTCRSAFVTVPRLSAQVRQGRIVGFFFPVGAQGE